MSAALQGKTIVNTRAVHQAEALNSLLRAHGALPVDYPCIAIVPPDDSAHLDAALRNLETGAFDWLVLTSANTVQALAERVRILGLDFTQQPFRTAAVGAATAEAAHTQLGLTRIELPADYDAEALAEHLPVELGARIFLPESAIARPTLAQRLTERGAVVSVVEAYQTISGQGGADVPRLLAQRQLDALIFTSSSTVTGFIERLKREGAQPEAALTLGAACIGTQTAATARENGFTTVLIASEQTLAGLIAALDTYFAQSNDDMRI